MRQGFNSPDFLFIDDKLIGVNIGFDFCAEHEFGIAGVKQKLGIGETGDPPGILTRINTKNDEYFFHTFKRSGEKYAVMFSKTCLLWGSYGINTLSSEQEKHKFYINKVFGRTKHLLENSPYNKEVKENFIATQWDSKDFEIVVRGEKFINNLKEIYNAYLAKNLCIAGTFHGNSFLKKLGLSFFIVSNLPQEWLDACEVEDKKQISLQKEFEKTKIEEILKQANKRYYALAPQFQSDGSLKFWLNPMDQEQNNYGWFTLNDLLDWAQNTGKIPVKHSS